MNSIIKTKTIAAISAERSVEEYSRYPCAFLEINNNSSSMSPIETAERIRCNLKLPLL